MGISIGFVKVRAMLVLVKGLPLEAAVACSEAAIALGDVSAARVYLSAGRTSSRLCRWRSARLWGARAVRLVVLGVLLLSACCWRCQRRSASAPAALLVAVSACGDWKADVK
jgi:uncharacterized membrane protein YfcA